MIKVFDRYTGEELSRGVPVRESALVQRVLALPEEAIAFVDGDRLEEAVWAVEEHGIINVYGCYGGGHRAYASRVEVVLPIRRYVPPWCNGIKFRARQDTGVIVMIVYQMHYPTVAIRAGYRIGKYVGSNLLIESDNLWRLLANPEVPYYIIADAIQDHGVVLPASHIRAMNLGIIERVPALAGIGVAASVAEPAEG